MAGMTKPAFLVTTAMLDAGEAEVRNGLPPRETAGRVYQAMRSIGVPRGRPRTIDPVLREHMKTEMRNGLSKRQLRRVYKIGGWLAAALEREIEEETPCTS